MKLLRVGVGELVQAVLRAGDLSFGFGAAARSAEGISAHRKLQRARPAAYQAEVAVVHRVKSGPYQLEISGRIDGLFQAPDRIYVEEIKSTWQKLTYFKENENPLHWGQLKIYAYIIAVQQDLPEIEAQLTYFQMASGATRSFKRPFKREALAAFFEDIVARYLKWVAAVENWGERRDASIKRLRFPFAAYRPGQKEMAAKVAAAIETRSRLIVQAATGIGKTMAAVFPALKGLAKGDASKIFYLTAKTTIRTVAEACLDELRASGLLLRSVTLTAKEKICFKKAHPCIDETCEFAQGYYDRLNGAMETLVAQSAFTREAIEAAARRYAICPFEFALDLSLFADFIICDYNYAFDPNVYLRRFFLEPNEDYIFLVDEAHNLVDRSREMFSAELSKKMLLDTRRALKKSQPDIYESISNINTWFVGAKKECEAQGGFQADPDWPEDLEPLLDSFVQRAERWLAQNLKTPFREALLELYHCVRTFLRVAGHFDDTYVTCYEKEGRSLKLRLFCRDASRQLAKQLERCRAAIFYSATLTPLPYFETMLGCGETAETYETPSPFPAENFCLLLADRISTLYKQRPKTKTAVSALLGAFIEARPGNYLIYCPSYQYLQMIYDVFAPQHPGTEILCQTPGMSEPQRDAFLKRFAEDNPQTLVGFAVMGGIFGEGIDLVGDRLCGAAILGVGLPAISPERDLLRTYYADTYEAGFEFAYIYPGINRVLQAAGRVVRTENDRGAVLLIDQRFSNRNYRNLLPGHWEPLRIENEREMAAALKDFWSA